MMALIGDLLDFRDDRGQELSARHSCCGEPRSARGCRDRGAAAGGRKAHFPRPGSGMISRPKIDADPRRIAQVFEPARQRDQVHPRGWDGHALRAAARRSALGHDRGYRTRGIAPERSRAHIQSLLASQGIGRRGNGSRLIHRAGNRRGAWRTHVGKIFLPKGDLWLHIAARTTPRSR